MTNAGDSIDLQSETDANGEIMLVQIRFGPHYSVEVREERGETLFKLRYTHHGFKADASQVGGELEAIVEEVRRSHPQASVD